MPCYHPLHAFKGKSEDKQKTLIVFTRPKSWKGERVDIPCGQCKGCRLERARQWAVRCVHEASMYEDNCFITLTYDDAHLPKNGSLCLRDFQLFMKRLRKRFGSGIKFYHCGEYGNEFSRPHYHALLFNHDFPDKEKFRFKNGNWIYTSNELSKLWDKGFSTVAQVSFDSAQYVAKYSMKKVTGKKADDYYGNMVPEYATMSRNKGIGKKWFDSYRGDVYPLDRVVINGINTRPPRYYDGLLGKDDPSTLSLLKIEREKKNERIVKDYEGGKEIVVSDSSDRRLIEKEKVLISKLELNRRHKDGV